MSTDETDDRSSGGPAHAFGNALAWKWSRTMPRSLKGGFLTLLYALRSMSSASGQLRFRDGKVIRIQDIAKAAGCREQDARRFLEAAIQAGVVVVIGERRRGIATLYSIVVTPFPDWKAAERHVKATARTRQEDQPSAEESSGHSGTNSDDGGSDHSGTNQFGPQRHEPPHENDEAVQSTVARPGSVHSGPTGSVHSGPSIPGVTHGLTHEMADAVTQPQVVGGPAAETNQSTSAVNEASEPFGRCGHPGCGQQLLRPGTTRCSTHRDPLPGQKRRSKERQYPTQPPLMAVVPDAPEEPASPLPFAWKPEDPTAPRRLCGCGRWYRSQAEAKCQDCQFAAHQEAETA